MASPSRPRGDRLPRRVACLLALVLASLLPPQAAAAAPRLYEVDPARSAVRFHALSRFVDVDGRFGRVSGEIRLDEGRLDEAAASITVDAASIDTGIERRDRHLRGADFLDVERHPRATFALQAARREAGQLVVSGTLTIHGVARPVTLPLSIGLSDGILRVAGELTLRRNDFGIAYQSWLNPIADEVTVRIDLTAIPR